MYNTLIGLGQYDEAFTIYAERLNIPMLRRLSASLQRIELLEMLFPEGLERPPKLSRQAVQARALNSLALAYHASGQPGRAAPMYFRASSLAEQENNPKNVSIGLGNMAETLRHTGTLRATAAIANRALLIDRAQEDRAGEALSLQYVGLSRAVCGMTDEAGAALQRSLRILIAQKNIQLEGVCNAQLAQLALWMGDAAAARPLADRAWELADHAKYEADYVRAACMQGVAALGMDDLEMVDERLHHALTRARSVNLVEFELQALIGLAELHRRREDFKAAQNLLEDVWEPAERGPYRLLHADAYNVLAQIERDAGLFDPAKQVAKAAFYLAWCDGEPYAYLWGLRQARAHLRALDVPEPNDLPPFDEAQFGPYLPVEVNPADEFGSTQQPAI
jgi:tetratricopeptide (TPR) repeat protein